MTEKTKKLYIKTHGCQMNEYDSARIQDLLGVSHNLEPTDNPEEADVLLLNTCSIREKAQEKVFHQLGRWKKLKDKNPDLLIGVGGCVARRRKIGALETRFREPRATCGTPEYKVASAQVRGMLRPGARARGREICSKRQEQRLEVQN